MRTMVVGDRDLFLRDLKPSLGDIANSWPGRAGWESMAAWAELAVS